MDIRKITCIQLGGEFPDLLYRSVMPDYGMPLIGTILKEAGYDVTVYIEHVKAPEWDRIAQSDLICFSSLCAGADKVYQLAGRIRAELRLPVIFGGTHATYFPESSLDYCDYVVLGEGDETIVELADALRRGGDPAQVPGIAFRRGGVTIRTAPRAGPAQFDTVPDFGLIEGYRRLSWLDMIRQRRVSWMTVQASRGCHFKCRFCIVNTMYSSGYRKRSIASVINDLKDKRRYGRELLFVDNDFGANRYDTKQLLRAIIAAELDFNILVFARVEIARDDELLGLMRRAGITQVYQGYESVQPDTLAAYDKRQTLEQVVKAIDKLHSFGFRIAGSFVVGADTDTRESLETTAQFVVEQELATAYFFPIWGHFPEQLFGYSTIVPWYRSIFKGWRYCDGNFVTHYPKNMPPSVLQRSIMEAFRTIYSPSRTLGALRRGKYWDAKWKAVHRWIWRDIEKGVRAYIPFLEEIEDGLYDTNGRLLENRLIERVQKDPRWTFQHANRTIGQLGLSPLELPIPRERNITCVPPAGAGAATETSQH
ncbi:MAG TPA: radical SAM protein [Candidatus Binataceae bacterium]|nr:radical SAM protein [Candidatus Binataceae bacterium]